MNIAELFSQLRWRPQIGDPTFMGWLTVAAYGLAAILCLIAAVHRPAAAPPEEPRRQRFLWGAVAALMLVLCVNKQLDLQSLLTDVGRLVAARGGWYEQRRIVQRIFVLAVAAGGALGLAVVAWKVRAVLRERRLLFVGLAFLLTFIIVRAASFHHVDVIIMSRLLGVRVNWILELSGIALIAISAAQAVRHPGPGAGPKLPGGH